MIRTAAGDVVRGRVRIQAMRPPRRAPGFFKSLLRFGSGRRSGEPTWHPGQVSQEERIATAIVVVLLAALVIAACAVYILNRDNARASAGAAGGVPAALRTGAAKAVRPASSRDGPAAV
jgi:hypothetical protein